MTYVAKYELTDMPKNKIIVFRPLVVWVPYWVKGTEKSLKCTGCGEPVDVHKPFHFQLCRRCRQPIWTLAIDPSTRRRTV